MTGNPILSHFSHMFLRPGRRHPADLHTLWRFPARRPPAARGALVERILDLLGPLDWSHFPERNLQRNWGRPAIPYAAFCAAFLLKLNEGLVSMGALHRYLREHPVFIGLFGFPVTSLPTQRHLTYMLRTLPNAVLQFLLADSLRLIREELSARQISFPDCISLDTKHILAFVKENNPKAYIDGKRYDRSQPPKGDPDCRLGCKRRHNRRKKGSGPDAKTEWVSVGEYHWGYSSGVVAAKAPAWGEFVLAELTQPFNCSDVSFFFPLMRQTEERLGCRPRFGTFDAAFDAFYVYEYFHCPDENGVCAGFAAVPFSEKGGYKPMGRRFNPEGLPLCPTGLAMPLKFTFTDRTRALIVHQRGKYVCPLIFPEPTGTVCPIQHKNWPKGGCTADMPTSIGARLRYQIDRDSPAYKDLYRQRSAVERINSQAVDLGIERPKFRNGQAIANQNTLIYILINLRFLQRLRAAA